MIETIYATERDGWNLFIRQNGFDLAQVIVPQLAKHWMLAYMDEHCTIQSDAEAEWKWLIKQDEYRHLRSRMTEPLRCHARERR